MTPLYFQFRRIDNEKTMTNIVEIVQLNIEAVNLEDEYRSNQLKDRKGNSKPFTFDRSVVRLPFRIGLFVGYLYLETKL